MIKKLDGHPIKHVVYPGNLSEKTRFKDVEYYPLISFKSDVDQSIYHIFNHYDLAWDKTVPYIAKEFVKGTTYQPIEISEEIIQRILKLLHSEV